MKLNFLPYLLLVLCLTLNSCSSSDDSGDDAYIPISPVVLDVTQVPYPKLSDYKFFGDTLKDLKPSYKVLPYKPASELFSDYAHKKRFVWMPVGKKATFKGNDKAMEFPVGAVLIKTFYFDHVLPNNTTQIIETRLMIKKNEATATASGWKTYNYIWNDTQTEAYLDSDGNGFFVPIRWNENGVEKNTFYKIPAFTECTTCHKVNPEQRGEITIPIGVKPQNLNNLYNYGNSQQNQLNKWVMEGYLENNIPGNINSTVDWTDTSKSLELRARSYLDVNCAHCHQQGGHCDYVNMRFNFSNSDLQSFGVCMVPLFNVQNLPFVINAGDADKSEMVLRMSSTNQSLMMPYIGRTVIHSEGVALIRQWINSMPDTCQ